MTVGAAVTGITFGLSQLTTESEFMATVSVLIYSSAGQNVFMAFFKTSLLDTMAFSNSEVQDKIQCNFRFRNV